LFRLWININHFFGEFGPSLELTYIHEVLFAILLDDALGDFMARQLKLLATRKLRGGEKHELLFTGNELLFTGNAASGS
jgi:hypothetical protein